MSEEDAAERDQRNQAIREAAERVDFKRRTQVLQRALPRPMVIEIASLMKNASEVEDPIEGVIAKEMALLIANDALKYPAPGAKVHGAARPLEVFEDELLNKARMEIALELPQDGMETRRQEFVTAWEEVHSSTKLPGLAGYEDDEVDERQLMVEAFDVGSACLLSRLFAKPL